MQTQAEKRMSHLKRTNEASLLLKLVIYVPDPWRILICKTCKIAIPLDSVVHHFSKTDGHRHTSSYLKAIVSAWKLAFLPTHPLSLFVKADLASWTAPPEPQQLEMLRVVDAFHCLYENPKTNQRCEEVYLSQETMRKHVKRVHGWINPNKQGRVLTEEFLKENPRPWEERNCQRLRHQGIGSTPWPIASPSKEAIQAILGQNQCALTEIPRPSSPQLFREDSPSERLLWAQAIETIQEPDCVNLGIENATTNRYPLQSTPWLERTGWPEYLSGCNFAQAQALITEPVKNEAELSRLIVIFETLMETIQETIKAQKVNFFGLIRLQSFVKGESWKRPFHTKVLKRTLAYYSRVWKLLLCFVYRQAVAKTAPQLHYKVTEAQRDALQSMFQLTTPTSSPGPVGSSGPKLRSSATRAKRYRRCYREDTTSEENSEQETEFQPTPSPPIGHVSPRDSRSARSFESIPDSPCPRKSGQWRLPTHREPSPDLFEYPSESEERMRTESRWLPSFSAVRRAKKLPVTTQEQQKCLSLCISLLDHPLGGREEDSLIVGFLAVLGINAQGQGFREPATYTTYLSGLVKIAQLLVLQSAVWESEQPLYHTKLNECIGALQDRFMVYGSQTPVDYILRLRNFGRRIQESTTTLGTLVWTDDYQRLSYQNAAFTINNLQWAVKDSVAEAWKQLRGLLLLADDLPESSSNMFPHLTLSKLHDNLQNSDAQFSFMKDPRNRRYLPSHSENFLYRMENSEILKKRFFTNHRKMVWNHQALREYFADIKTFLSQLLLLIHITGGQPARGTELLPLRWRNSNCGEIRNIFVEDGMMMFVTSYHKGYSTHNKLKIIQRYLPDEVGRLLVYYLWLVIPFQQTLHKIVPQNRSLNPPHVSSYLWPVGIHQAGMLHWRRNTQQGSPSKESEGSCLHCTPPIEECWKSDRLGDVIENILGPALGTRLILLWWRHCAIAISRIHMPETCRFKLDRQETSDSALDLQAGHSTKQASMRYARGADEGPGFSVNLREQYRTVSTGWHKVLGFGKKLPKRDTLRVDEVSSPLKRSFGTFQESSNVSDNADWGTTPTRPWQRRRVDDGSSASSIAVDEESEEEETQSTRSPSRSLRGSIERLVDQLSPDWQQDDVPLIRSSSQSKSERSATPSIPQDGTRTLALRSSPVRQEEVPVLLARSYRNERRQVRRSSPMVVIRSSVIRRSPFRANETPVVQSRSDEDNGGLSSQNAQRRGSRLVEGREWESGEGEWGSETEESEDSSVERY